jgi:predicted peptidase
MIKRFRKYGKSFMALMLSTSMVLSSGVTVLAADGKSTSYSTITEIHDWGAAIPRVVVDLGKTVNKDSISNDTFKVHVKRTENRPDTIMLGAAEGDRTITKAYVSDKDGNAVDNGSYVTIEMEIGPTVDLGSPLNYSLKSGLNGWVDSDYTITQLKDITTGTETISGLVIDSFSGDRKKLVDDFTVGSGTYDNINLKYASYAPETSGEKKPLVIWLHGMGEGGTDGLLPISANKAANFASEDIQSYFDGAYVLAPQTPTMWMQGPNGEFGGKDSKYTKALMGLIEDYVSKNSNIDKNRIYIGGDSNGGYMTMVMAREYTDYFAAAFPTCEALADSLITDSDIQKMKDLPMWFIASKDDTTVDINNYVVPTYNRLKAAGAENLHLSLYDSVVDQTGLYKNPDGTPYKYNGHWSWIYVYNNDPKDIINGKETTIMEWLASQNKSDFTTYNTITEIEDWGPATTKVVIDLGQTVKEGSVNTDSFSAFVSRSDKRLATPLIQEGYRNITKAYVSDAKGNASKTGNYATLEMEIGPSITLGSPFNYVPASGGNAWIDTKYIITQEKNIVSDSTIISRLVANELKDQIKVGVDDFDISKATYDNVTLSYASYAPAKDNGKNPLVIWLHGGGEGGSDATVPISGNKAVNFSSKEIQDYFGGAYVLTPQAPTRWMQTESGKLDGTSIYTKALMSLIKDYVSKNDDIDANRIYIGGCSNGGYMTMVMIRDYPEYFAAAFPVCEGLNDSLISDSDLEKMKETPIWFVAASTDKVLPPAINTVPTYERLIKAGAKNVYLSLFDKVIDTTGLYKNADGTPYEYNGHWSWIYVFNNEVSQVINGKQTSIMEWMAAQSLKKVETPVEEPTEEQPTQNPTNTDVKTAPKTGDTAPIAPLLVIMTLSIVGIYISVRKKSA